jgi:hypothetical protein
MIEDLFAHRRIVDARGAVQERLLCRDARMPRAQDA